MTDVKLRLTNTLTRAKEEFAPIDPNNVRMYVCGPTVYDFAHIGNARPVIVFDVLFRLLKHLYPGPGTALDGGRVTYVRNITDVDDKINDRALRDFGKEIADGTLSLNEAIRRVTEKTANQFHDDVKALGCLEPTHEPRATEFVEPRDDGRADMITLIQNLIARGHAYEAKGEVLFDTASMPDYGHLSKRNLDEQQAGARVAVDAHKKSPGDFVLWKLSSPEEPGWNSPWGRGRPGWHIECSAMSDALLWDAQKHKLSPEALALPHQFDIHGGGLDLIFPHHENEIAQSRCAHGTSVMANYWLHNGFLEVEGQKMSKSTGNFVTISELLNEGWDGRVLRLLMLKTHYRQPINWTRDGLQKAALELHKLARFVPEGPQADQTQDAEFAYALQDDLNTPLAIASLHRIAGQTLGNRSGGVIAIDASTDMAYARLYNAFSLLGFDEVDQFDANVMFARLRGAVSYDEADVRTNIDRRLAFIAAKNWAEADRIRDELLAQGIQLKDGKDPLTGERITTWEVKR